MTRCSWAREELMCTYHDEEWGVPLHDDRALFEFLVLEGAQAGLSWSTIQRKRSNYRKAFDKFDARKVARSQEGALVGLIASHEQLGRTMLYDEQMDARIQGLTVEQINAVFHYVPLHTAPAGRR